MADPILEWCVKSANEQIEQLRARIAQLERARELDGIALKEMIADHRFITAENQRLQSEITAQVAMTETLSEHAADLQFEVDTIRAENQRLRADSERLDWLVTHGNEVYLGASKAWCAGGDLVYTVHEDLER